MWFCACCEEALQDGGGTLCAECERLGCGAWDLDRCGQPVWPEETVTVKGDLL
jgi:hypothetical protein